MLTRIEISGFKTFDGFGIDLGPFVGIVGPNAAGKSNLFDAIRLLSRMAEMDLRSAMMGVRGEPIELFRRRSDGAPGATISFAVEVLLDPRVRDPWGAMVEIEHSRIRYEVDVERRVDERGVERLFVTREDARPIKEAKDRWGSFIRGSSEQFKKIYLKYNLNQKYFLETRQSDDKSEFKIYPAGQGRPQSVPAEAAEATVLYRTTSAEYPYLYALREELRSWRFLQLNPAAMRRPSSAIDSERLKADGSNLASVLARIRMETARPDRPDGALADIAADLGSIVAGILDLGVEEDPRHREYRVDLGIRGGPRFSSRVISDGTIRSLALLTLLHDPKHRGLICLEEPENGIHPGRLGPLIHLLRDRVSDPSRDDFDPGEPLSQVLFNTHSPVVLAHLKDGERRLADLIDVVDPTTRTIDRKTRIRSVRSEPARAQRPLGFMANQRDDVWDIEVDSYLSSANPGV